MREDHDIFSNFQIPCFCGAGLDIVWCFNAIWRQARCLHYRSTALLCQCGFNQLYHASVKYCAVTKFIFILSLFFSLSLSLCLALARAPFLVQYIFLHSYQITGTAASYVLHGLPSNGRGHIYVKSNTMLQRVFLTFWTPDRLLCPIASKWNIIKWPVAFSIAQLGMHDSGWCRERSICSALHKKLVINSSSYWECYHIFLSSNTSLYWPLKMIRSRFMHTFFYNDFC